MDAPDALRVAASAAPGRLTAEQADAFWRRFRAWEAQALGLPPAAFVAKVNAALAEHVQGLAIELEPTLAQGRTTRRILRVTAHGNSPRFPEVQLLAQRASVLAHHLVQPFRARVSDPRFALQHQGLRLATREVRVAVQAVDGQVGLQLALPALMPSDERRQAERMVMEMLSHVLGEWDLAVRVGPMSWPLALPAQTSVTLSELPTAFDAVCREQLGCGGAFPVEDEGPGALRQVHDRAHRLQALDWLNLGARAVALRPDLSHAVWLSLPAHDEASLERALELQLAATRALQTAQLGVLTLARLEGGRRRLALYMVGDPAQAGATLGHLCGRLRQLDFEVRSQYDPRWQHYRAVLADHARGVGVWQALPALAPWCWRGTAP